MLRKAAAASTAASRLRWLVTCVDSEKGTGEWLNSGEVSVGRLLLTCMHRGSCFGSRRQGLKGVWDTHMPPSWMSFSVVAR